MLLYHGSNVEVKSPKLIGQVRGLDFGAGFYTTSNLDQAIEFTRHVARRKKTPDRVVSVYEFHKDSPYSRLHMLKFESPDAGWLDFVRANRFNEYNGEAYDLIVGPVANDDIYPTLQAYFEGVFSREQALDALKIKKLYDQYVFASEKALDAIRFVRAFEPEEGR
jgi:hypothetical protein